VWAGPRAKRDTGTSEREATHGALGEDVCADVAAIIGLEHAIEEVEVLLDLGVDPALLAVARVQDLLKLGDELVNRHGLCGVRDFAGELVAALALVLVVGLLRERRHDV